MIFFYSWVKNGKNHTVSRLFVSCEMNKDRARMLLNKNSAWNEENFLRQLGW